MPQSPVSRGISIVVLIAAVLGFADATFLAVLHFQNVIPPCAIGGCELVTTSTWSVIFGVPVALLGSIYYLILACLCLALFLYRRKGFGLGAAVLSGVGFLFSLFLVYLQLFVIHSICIYCMFSALTTTVIFWSLLISHLRSRSVPSHNA